VPINDPESFAAAAQRLLSEPGLRDRLSAGARHRAVAQFDQHVMVGRSLELYGQVAAEDARDWPVPSLVAAHP
jgi:glycosyltransferase involved in cell wall biosynthesis